MTPILVSNSDGNGAAAATRLQRLLRTQSVSSLHFPRKDVLYDSTLFSIMNKNTLRLHFCELDWDQKYSFVESIEILTDEWIGSTYFVFPQESANRTLHPSPSIQSDAF